MSSPVVALRRWPWSFTAGKIVIQALKWHLNVTQRGKTETRINTFIPHYIKWETFAKSGMARSAGQELLDLCWFPIVLCLLD